MNDTLTELVFVVDRSGSMDNIADDAIGGFNATLKKQREEPGDVLVSTVLFNHRSQVVHDRVPLAQIPQLTEETYHPSGCTALLDALGDAIHHIGNIHKYARPEDVPAHTLFAIITDGLENASRRHTADEVRAMITRQKEKYGWEFAFLAANIDAVETAERYGIDAEEAIDFHADRPGVCACMDYLGGRILHARRGLPRDRTLREKVDRDFRSR